MSVLQAKGEHILIKPYERKMVFADQIKKRSGLLVSTAKTEQGYPNMGWIYSIGDECPDDLGYKVGDLVVFDVKIVEGIKWEGKSLLIAHWGCPQATLKEEDL